MITKFLIPTMIFLFSRAYAQTNSEGTLDKCAQKFQEGNETAPFDPDKEMRKNEELRECLIGKKFPAFSATDLIGGKYSNLDLIGKVILVNSWSVDCAPCIAEMPLLNELNLEFGDRGFLLLSFSRDETEYVNKFLEDKPANFIVFPNSRELIVKKMKIAYGYPINIFLNKNGEIVEFSSGGSVDEKELHLTKAKFREILTAELAK